MFGENEGKPFKSRSNSSESTKKTERNFEKRSDERPFGKKSFSSDKGPEKTERNFEKRSDERPFGKKSFSSDKGPEKRGESKRPFGKKSFDGKADGDKPFNKKPFKGGFDKNAGDRKHERPFERKPLGERKFGDRNEGRKWSSEERLEPQTRSRKNAPAAKDDGLIRLNRYIANAGICSRRKADELIEAGVVSVNGEVVSELGFKVDPAKDVIRYNGETLKREKMVYVLLNKPKDYITTTDDPQERRTVMQLVDKASRERIYPVGRLDRNTTGLLLMTNDGDLAEKLSHPRNNITKIYNVELNKSLTQGDFNKLQFGLELEDGLIKPDVVSYVQGASKREIGIQIHSGKNRIVRRMFEHLGYDVVKLDRVVYANLTKKDLPRGRWRYLEDKEIIQLKHLIR